MTPSHNDADTSPFGTPDPSGEHLYPYNILLERIDGVIGEWRTLAKKEPWSQIPGARLIDAFPEILPKMFKLAGMGAMKIDGELSEVISEAHGYFRRADGVPLSAMAEEWNFVKRACWKVLNGAGVDAVTVTSALQRIDLLVDDAIGLSLRGYYAPELNELKGKGLERRDGVDERRMNDPNRRS